jgi:hypothetical protein
MYAIDIASDQFKGLSIVKQHRKINEILKDEIKGMHGLQVCRHGLEPVFLCQVAATSLLINVDVCIFLLQLKTASN